MSRLIDITGKRFGRLIVIGRSSKKAASRDANWNCQCVCGNTAVSTGWNLRNGHTRSCGCLIADVVRAVCTTHSMSDSSEYRTWASMIQRCKNPKTTSFGYCGARGIHVCARWMTFGNFIADMGFKPNPEYELDRINNDGNYEPGNCRWADRITQSNNRRSNRRITYNGISLTIAQWARLLGVKFATLHQRIVTYNWPIEDALFRRVRTIRR